MRRKRTVQINVISLVVLLAAFAYLYNRSHNVRDIVQWSRASGTIYGIASSTGNFLVFRNSDARLDDVIRPIGIAHWKDKPRPFESSPIATHYSNSIRYWSGPEDRPRP